MKIKILLNTLFVFLTTWQTSKPVCTVTKDESAEQVLQLKKQKRSKDILISFSYTNESLVNIINQLAAYQGMNILFPSAKEKLDINVTLNKAGKVSLDEAWSIVNTFLDIAGFCITPKGNINEIVPSATASKDPLPTYINIHPEQLPDNNFKIRYLYYFQNINVSSVGSSARKNIEAILGDMLPGTPTAGNFIVDAKSNCLILLNKTKSIKDAMNIILALDQEGFREAIEIVPLVHTSASNIHKTLNSIIKNKSGSGSFPYGGSYGQKSSGSDDTYFSKDTSIVNIDRSNAIAIMGKIDSVAKVKNFILKHLDVPSKSGRSIIHVKSLQYLDAKDVAPVIQKVLRARNMSMQAMGPRGSSADGLSKVIVMSESYEDNAQIQQLKPQNNSKKKSPNKKSDKKNQQPKSGSNNLIIAARGPEWEIVERLIDEIDQPQQQVAIEALIVDLTLTEGGKIAAQTRNLNIGKSATNLGFQSAHINKPWLNYQDAPSGSAGFTGEGTVDPAKNLVSNLLKPGSNVSGKYDATTTVLDGVLDSGSTVLSFDDGNGIASLIEMFKSDSNAKVLSQPFITTTNHQQAAISSSNERLVEGSVRQESTGGPVIKKKDTIKADLTVDILPRISKSNNINLEILVHANEFSSNDTSNDTILQREVQTNANLANNEVLVIGGLTKIESITKKTGLPVVSRIPIVGNLFKKRKETNKKSTLMIFIAPKIIKPKKGISAFVQEKLELVKDQISQEELSFGNMSDPITRILFPAQAPEAAATINEFASQEVFEDPTELTPRQNKKRGAISSRRRKR